MTLELSNVANLPITIYPGHEDRADLLHADDRARDDAVRRVGDRLEVQGPEGPDAEPLLQELRGTASDPRHRRHRLRRAARRACAARARAAGARARARPASRRARSPRGASELVEGDVTDPGVAARGDAPASTRSSTSSRSSRARAPTSSAIMVAGHAQPRRRREGGGRAALRARERARPRRAARRTPCRTSPRSGRWSAP